MEHAILITAYKNSAHLLKIIKFFATSAPRFTLFIHLDKKSGFSDADIRILQQKDNVKLVSQQYNVNWGGVNHLKAILLLLESAFKQSNADYFHLITGHDFPIQSPEKFTAFFEENKGKDFLEYFRLPYSNWQHGGLDRLMLYNLYDLFDGRAGWKEALMNNFLKIQKRLKIARKFPPHFPDLYGGSTYWSLCRKSVEYTLNYIDTHSDYLRRFNYTFCAEEIFFQTILMNSPLKGNAVNDNLRFIVWKKRNGNYPANLDETDYDAIKASNAFFARKFEYPVSERLLEKLIEIDKTNHEVRE
jgi:hypothetical protein